MVLMSSACAIVVGIGAYYILMSTGMDTANVMSSINVRLGGHMEGKDLRSIVLKIRRTSSTKVTIKMIFQKKIWY